MTMVISRSGAPFGFAIQPWAPRAGRVEVVCTGGVFLDGIPGGCSNARLISLNWLPAPLLKEPLPQAKCQQEAR
jgi:hypothetical protein